MTPTAKVLNIQPLNIHKAYEMMSTVHPRIADIRDKSSFLSGHIAGAYQISNDNIDEFIKISDKKKPLLCCCYHGVSSLSAAEYFLQNGFQEVYSLEGGFEAWRLKYPYESSA